MLIKPSSVPQSGDNHLSRLPVARKLKRRNPEGSAGSFIPSLFGLAPNGVYLANRLLGCWCALTAPFHPYRPKPAVHISVALSLRSPSPDVIRHSALWISDFPRLPYRIAAIIFHTHTQTNLSQLRAHVKSISINTFATFY